MSKIFSKIYIIVPAIIGFFLVAAQVADLGGKPFKDWLRQDEFRQCIDAMKEYNWSEAWHHFIQSLTIGWYTFVLMALLMVLGIIISLKTSKEQPVTTPDSIDTGGDKISQHITDGVGVVQTGSGSVNIGITIQEYEQRLDNKEKEVVQRLTKAHDSQKHFLQEQLVELKESRADLKASYEKYVEDLKQRITQLETLRGDISDNLLEQAQRALADSNTEKAEAFFLQIEEQSDKHIKAVAEAKYQRCRIEEEKINYDLAFSLCSRAVQLNSENTLYLNALGTLAHTLGRYKEAIVNHELALESDLETYGEDHPKIAVHYNNLGCACQALGKNKKAMKYHELALASSLNIYGEDHPNVALCRSNLGFLCQALGENHKAMEYYEQAFASDLKTYGEDHSQIALRRNNLGVLCQALGEYKKAMKYHEQALASDLNTYGEDHPKVALCRNNLGSAWQNLGEHEKAMESFEQALASDLKTYGEDHPDVAIDLNNLGGAWKELGEYEKAIECFKQALAIDLKIYDEDHPQVDISHNNLSSAWQALENI